MKEDAAIQQILDNIKNIIQEKYWSYIHSYMTDIYPVRDCPFAGFFKERGNDQLSFDLPNLNLAINEIMQDIRFIVKRADSLFREQKMDR
jgi:hypothetical protein